MSWTPRPGGVTLHHMTRVLLSALVLSLLAFGCSQRPIASGPVRVASTDDPLFTEGDHLPGRPDLRICKREWTAEQCCAFLCRCLTRICPDSAKGRPGIVSCPTWCPRIDDTARRCHVYHCYVSISPTGGINDHDSHCGHAAHQVRGGACPAEVTR